MPFGIEIPTATQVAEFFDLESSDGVHRKPEGSSNTLKSSLTTDNTLQLAGKTDTNTLDVKGLRSVYYTKEFDSVEYKPETGPSAGMSITDGPRPYAIFNKYSLANYRGTPLTGSRKGNAKIEYNKIDPETLQNPTVSKIIEITSQKTGSGGGANLGYRYNYSDFALCKYFGRIPNNMMITLRRFPFPCPDDIVTPQGIGPDGKMEELQQPDIARAVTWMGEAPGNPFTEIVKFDTGINWKEETADVQDLQSQRKGKSGAFGSFFNSSALLKAGANAAEGRGAYESATREANAGYDAFKNTYPNHVFGPYNVIKQVLAREQGLTMSQEFTLKFEYELRSFAGANPKIMMLDQLANIMALTYNTAPFWGGAVRYIGDGSVGKPLGDLGLLREGKYGSFLKSVVSDLGGMFKGVGSDIAGIFEGKDSKVLNNLIGGTLQKLFNSPQGGQVANSLLTGDPTGQWHVTVGNPLNPIMVIGNLACTGTKVSFDGPMGLQDFPEKMFVEVTLKPGRPRDKADIESMFNAGRGRFYLQPSDTADINDTFDVSQYGNKDRKGGSNPLNSEFRKISNG